MVVRSRLVLLVLFLVAATPVSALSQVDASPPHHTPDAEPGRVVSSVQPAARALSRVLAVPTIDVALRLDGRLDEPAWARAAVADRFTQFEPQSGERPSQQTEVRLFATPHAFVIGARLHDAEPSRIVATEFVRDADLEANDTFEVFLDTYRDRRNAFYFATNAVGARRDGMVRNEGESLNWEWDGVWEVASRRDETGWVVEIEIPLSTLRFRPGAADGWGVNFGRVVARSRESSYWVPLDRDWGFMTARWRVSAYGLLTGLDKAKRQGRLQLKPFGLGGAEGDWEVGTGSPEATGKLGLDAKVAVSDTLTADLTVNTDFAQVESDQQQVNLTRFALFYPEKREFFLENAGLFQVGERYDPFEPPTTLLFFSRTVGLTEDGDEVPLYGGVRVTGKVGPYDLGLMDIASRETRIDAETRLPDTNIAALRVKRDILSRSTVGAFLFSKTPAEEGTSNQVFGADANLALTSTFKINAVAARSVTPGLEGSSHMGLVGAEWSTDRGGFGGSYADIGDAFNAELGFLQRTGVRKYRLGGLIARRPGRFGLRQVFVMDDFKYTTDRSGQLETRTNGVGAAAIFDKGGFLVVQWISNAERLTESFEVRDGVEIPVGRYDFNQAMVMYRGDSGRRVSFNGMMMAGGFFGGTLGSYNVGAQVRPHGRLTLGLDVQRNNVDVPAEGGTFSTNLVIGRAVLAFSPRAFLRALYQWNDDDRESRANVLFRFTYRPGSDLFVVYNEDRGIRGEVPRVKRRSLLVKFTVLSIPW